MMLGQCFTSWATRPTGGWSLREFMMPVQCSTSWATRANWEFMMLGQCFTSWAIRPTGGWSLRKFIIPVQCSTSWATRPTGSYFILFFVLLASPTGEDTAAACTNYCGPGTRSQFCGGRKPECPEKTLEVRLRLTQTQCTYNIVVEVEAWLMSTTPAWLPKEYSTGYFIQMVTHPDINPVQQGLTSVNRQEPVFSLWW